MIQLESSTISKRSSAGLQSKLEIGQPGDKYEQEADAVADRVMRMPDINQIQMQPMEEQEEEMMLPTNKMQPLEEEMLQPKIQMQPMEEEEEMLQPKIQRQAAEEEDKVVQPVIQRQSGEEEEESLQMKPFDGDHITGNQYTSDHINQGINSSSGSGNALPVAVQAEMGQKIGADFSSVNIHTDSQSEQMSKELGAQAFTHGSDIYFDRGKYNPGTSEGKHLLAHELTHVLQQGGIPQMIQRRTREESLEFAQQLNNQFPNWLDALPDCPCTYQEAMADPATWRDATSPFTQTYHPGARHDVRTVNAYTSSPGSHHGQQCTYDNDGNLITEGAGAGTPDLWAPDDGLLGQNFRNHQRDDVSTFNDLGWRVYTQYWRPNQGRDSSGAACTPNAGGGRRMSSGRYQIIGNFREIDLFIISIPLRTVTASENVFVRETGRTQGGMVGGRGHYSLVEVLPDSPAAITLFGNDDPQFIPDYLLTPIP